MQRFPFAMWADILFYSACSFVLCLSILRLAAPLWVALLCAVLIALAAGGVCFLLLSRRRRKRLLTKKEGRAREALLLHLALEKPERVRASLLAAYLADGKNARCEGDALLVDGTAVVPLFTMEPVGADAVASLLRSYGKTPFKIVCNALTAEAEKLLSSFGVEAERGDGVYALFTRTNSVPDPLICGEIPRKTAKQKLRAVFQKSHARPFFVSGVLLLVMSLFAFLPLYYVISGSALLLCAVTVRLFGEAN